MIQELLKLRNEICGTDGISKRQIRGLIYLLGMFSMCFRLYAKTHVLIVFENAIILMLGWVIINHDIVPIRHFENAMKK